MYNFLYRHMFSFLLSILFQKLPECFPNGLHHFTFPPAMHEVSNCQHLFYTNTCFLLDSSHHNECEAVSHGLDLVSWASFYVFIIGHSWIFHGEIAIQILYPFFIGLSFCCWVIYSGYKSFFGDTICKMLSQTMGCLFTFSMISLEAQMLLILIKYNLFFLLFLILLATI